MFMQNVRMQYYKTRSLASLASKKKQQNQFWSKTRPHNNNRTKI